jgi:hypothetical protein
MRRIVLTAVVATACGWVANAQPQNDPTGVTVPSVGGMPAGTYSVSQLESINAATGGLSLRIPITKLPPARGGFSGSLNLVYNSQIYDVNEYWDYSHISPCMGVAGPPGCYTEWRKLGAGLTNGGWQYEWDNNYTLLLDPTTYDQNGGDPCELAGRVYRMVLYFPDGSRHVLHLPQPGGTPYYWAYQDDGYGRYSFYPGFPAPPSPGAYQTICNQPAPAVLNYHTTDGTFIEVNVNNSAPPWSWTIRFPDGRSGFGNGSHLTSMSDSNGNAYGFSTSAPPGTNNVYTTMTDALGRTITVQRVLGVVPTNPPLTVPVSDYITQAGTGGQGLQWRVDWTIVYVTTQPLPATQRGDTASATVAFTPVADILLPTYDDGAQGAFTFLYNQGPSGWGELNKVLLPSGATVDYTYYGYGSGVGGFPLNLLFLDPVKTKTLTWVDSNLPGFPQRTETSSYSYTTTSSVFTNASGGQTLHSFYPIDPSVNTFFPGQVYYTRQPDGTEINQVWAQNTPLGCNTATDPCNPYVQWEFRTVPAGGPVSTALTAATNYSYDQNGNKTGQLEYDWTPGNSVIQRTTYGIPSGYACPSPCTGPLRTIANTFLLPTYAAGTQLDNANAYWNNTGPNGAITALDRPRRSIVSGSGSNAGPGSIAEYSYPSGFYNITQEAHWDSTLSPTQPNCFNEFGHEFWLTLATNFGPPQ